MEKWSNRYPITPLLHHHIIPLPHSAHPMRVRFIRATAAIAVSVLVGGLSIGLLHAQRNQPIYPAYDGFVKNPDGSYTLAFGYFNHNRETVTIPPGTGNFFSPLPADRRQPTTFLPGQHRFQCPMVVGPDFDGKLR